MTKTINIIAKTDKGTIAIEKQIADSFKLKIQEKAMFKMMGYKREVTNQNPLVLTITLKNKAFEKMLRADHFEGELDKTLISEGLTKDIDYSMEVLNE